MGKIRKPKYTPEQLLKHVVGNTLVLSNSRIKYLGDGGSPFAFFNNYTKEKNVTPSMELGSLVDLLFLTPNDFDYLVKGRDDKKEIENGDPFKVITKEQYDKALFLAQSIELNVHAQKLKEGKKQHEIKTDILGVPFIGYSDVFNPAKKRVVELKTTSKPLKYTSLNWELKDRDYDQQGAIYCHATGAVQYHIIWVNTTSGACCTMNATSCLDEGFYKLENNIKKYKKLQYGAKYLGLDVFQNNTIKPIIL